MHHSSVRYPWADINIRSNSIDHRVIHTEFYVQTVGSMQNSCNDPINYGQN